MVFAQILNGVIVNVIVLDDPTLKSLFAQGFDACVQIDQMSPVPGIGYTTLDNINFTPPSQV